MFRSHARFCIVCGIVAMLIAWLLCGELPSANAQPKAVSFIQDVAPILKENCFACHDAKKRSGKYEMTTFEKLSTERLTAGKPAESEIYELITHKGDRRMPPKKDNLAPLKPEQIAVIKTWIEQGAKLDSGIDTKADLVKELRVRWKPPVPKATYDKPVIVNALTFSPDNAQLVIGGHHELTVWNIADGKLLKRIYTRAERAMAMVFLPDGKLVVAGSRPGQEGDVRVYDITQAGKTENGVAVLDGVNDTKVLIKHVVDVEDSVLCLALSADGKKLASGGCDRIVRVWDISNLASPKLEQSIENHADWVFGVTFAPDGKHLLTCSRDKTAKVWDLSTKESVLTFPDHQAGVWGVAVKADSKVGYSVGADKQMRMWNSVGDGKQIKIAGNHGDDITKLVSHPSKPVMVTASADKTVKVWDSGTGATTKTFPAMNDYVFSAAISPDATLVAAGAYDGEVRVWKVADASVVKAWNASPGYNPPAPPMPPKK